MKKFKKHRGYGFFDQDIRLSKLSQLGDPLERLDKGVDFGVFREILEKNFSKLAKGKGGRPPYDYVLLFKMLVLQRFYNLSDDKVEYQVNDRMSFIRFLGLTISDDVPDGKTVWNFREKIVDLGIMYDLFSIFLKNLEKLGLIANKGRIIDASFVEVPRQRNKKEESNLINGKIPENFKVNPNKLSQKDTDARWTKKNNINYFGHKNHIKADSKSKIVLKYGVTNASVHDSQAMGCLLDSKDAGQDLHADSAYVGEKQEKTVVDNKMTAKII